MKNVTILWLYMCDRYIYCKLIYKQFDNTINLSIFTEQEYKTQIFRILFTRSSRHQLDCHGASEGKARKQGKTEITCFSPERNSCTIVKHLCQELCQRNKFLNNQFLKMYLIYRSCPAPEQLKNSLFSFQEQFFTFFS